MASKAPKRKFITDLDDPEYLIGLGQFIAQFAQVESVLNQAVWHFSKLGKDPQIARAIFGPLRVDAATNHLNRLIEARHLRGRNIEELKLILNHLGQIARMRNDIVHLGADGYGRLTVTNRPYVHARNRIRTAVVNAKILKQMEDDLLDMFTSLSIISGEATDRSMRKWQGFLSKETWRYKPRVQVLRPRKRRLKLQGRQHLR